MCVSYLFKCRSFACAENRVKFCITFASVYSSNCFNHSSKTETFVIEKLCDSILCNFLDPKELRSRQKHKMVEYNSQGDLRDVRARTIFLG